MSNHHSNGHTQRVRSASHAGSWYSDNSNELDAQLTNWLANAGPVLGQARAIISPHAGYSYCGETAAYAFKQIPTHRLIFVLGPSHVVYLSGCALTTCSKYQTPLGDLTIDTEGNRFRYTPNDPSSGRPIHEQIAELDQHGMDLISTLDPPLFNDYLKKTQNTICGRNPICAAEHFRQMNNHKAEFRFLKYSQSNKCRNMNDSSVSYAAGALFITPNE